MANRPATLVATKGSMPSVTQLDIDAYATLMDELRLRLDVVESFINGRSNSVYIRTNTESMCLQLRKCLELIAFASLVANREAYANVRADIAKDWHAARIIKKLRTINAHFFPVPVGERVTPDRHQDGFKQIKELALTPRHLIHLYDKCGDLLHATNPFTENRNFLAFSKRIPTYLLRIRALTRHHLIWLVGMEEGLHVTVPESPSLPVTVTTLYRPKRP